MTRTHNKHIRVYDNGVDISGYTRSVGQLGCTFDAEPDMAITDEVKNILIGKGDVSAGPYSAFLDNDTAGLFQLRKSGNGTANLMVAIGANAAPVAGNPVFAWTFEQSEYKAEPGAGFVAASVTYAGPSFSGPLSYKRPWGVLIHPKGEETAVNSAVGIDDIGASSALGGMFCYQIHASDGTVTVKMQDAATNADGSFADLTGATSGEVDATLAPVSGQIPLSISATVRRYLRWQIVLGTATEVTFTTAFIRNNMGN